MPAWIACSFSNRRNRPRRKRSSHRPSAGTGRPRRSLAGLDCARGTTVEVTSPAGITLTVVFTLVAEPLPAQEPPRYVADSGGGGGNDADEEMEIVSPEGPGAPTQSRSCATWTCTNARPTRTQDNQDIPSQGVSPASDVRESPPPNENTLGEKTQITSPGGTDGLYIEQELSRPDPNADAPPQPRICRVSPRQSRRR